MDPARYCTVLNMDMARYCTVLNMDMARYCTVLMNNFVQCKQRKILKTVLFFIFLISIKLNPH